MSDPNHVRKGRRGVWAWGIAWAMALTSVLYIWSVLDGDTQQVRTTAPVTAATAGAELRHITAYRAFVASPGIHPNPRHEYTAAGIERLADAMYAVAEIHAALNETLTDQRNTFFENADVLRADRTSRDHADIVKDVFTSAVGTLEYLQRASRLDSPSLRARIADLRQFARDIDAAEPLLRQQAGVRQFFEGSSEVLYTLATAS